jgi:hypothetical protein
VQKGICTKRPSLAQVRATGEPQAALVQISRFALCTTATHYSVVDQQHHHRAHDCDDHAVNVQACDSGRAEQIKEKTADESADDSKGDVEPETCRPTILLPMNPAIKPRMIQLTIPI